MGFLFVCSFVMRFYTVSLISNKFVMMVKDLPMEVLDSCKREWGLVQDNLLPHYFLCKKGIDVMRRT
jgi:hypothetical protein